MIYTFTPNPAIDYYIRLDSFNPGEINRVSEYSFTEAGKGINCSEMMSILGIPSTAVFFSAGFTGKYIDEALGRYPLIRSFPIQTEGVTRINLKFIGEQDTAINARGPAITDEAKHHLKELVSTLTADDVFIVSGSLPEGYTSDEAHELFRDINRQGARLVLDVPFLLNEQTDDLDIFLIKPNLEEFSAFTGRILDENNYFERINEVLEKGKVRNILLSLGSHGSCYVGEYGCYQIRVPAARVFSPVGAGDCTLGAFIGTLYITHDIECALKTANAAGCARVQYGKAMNKQNVLDLIDKIELR